MPESGRAPQLLTPQGLRLLDELGQQRPLLLAFDFDGTLAPIVARPADARPARAVLARLAQLAACTPVAVISGRSLADLRSRLPGVAAHLVGNHGAEPDDDPHTGAHWTAALQPLRQRLQVLGGALTAAGIGIEDKGASIALHLRLAPQPARARAVLDDLLPQLAEGCQVFGGKQVLNLVARGCPDKADAMQALVARCGAAAALYAGDDVNDEPVFERAPAHWLTLRVGSDDPRSSARVRLDGPSQMPRLLDLLLQRLQAT